MLSPRKYTAIMAQHEQAEPSLLTTVAVQLSRRRHRITAIAAVLFTLFSLIWLYNDLGIDNLKARIQDGFATTPSSGDFKKHSDHLLTPKIWQILLPKKESDRNSLIDPERLSETASWLAMNPDYTYTLVGEKGSNEFVNRHFAKHPEIVDAFNSLPNVGMKSDLLRYLLLEVEGGVYTDTDTVALKPIDLWIPAELQDKVRLVVGIEFDRRDGPGWADIAHEVQFCQWTIAAAPGHPVFRKMVNRILQSLDDLSETHKSPIELLEPASFEVMNSTGPAAWTDAVFAQLQEIQPLLNGTEDLKYMTEPTLFGDVLVLTIDGFGMGQAHSASTNDGTIPKAALMRHLFRGSWRGNE